MGDAAAARARGGHRARRRHGAGGDRRSHAEYTVVVVLEDDAAWVDEQERRIAARLGPPAERRDAEAAADLVQRLADLEDQAPARLSLVTPWNSPAALGVLNSSGLAKGLEETAVYHALAGRLHVFPETPAAAGTAATLGRSGFAVIEARGFPGLETSLPLISAVIELRGRIREALDPDHTLGYGDRWQRG